MNYYNKSSYHLIRNLDRISSENSIFNYESGRKPFSTIGKGNIHEWLETFLPNTRIILEPKIIGFNIGIQYIDGRLKKAINENCEDITKIIMSLKDIPKLLPFKNTLEIQGVLYEYKKTSTENRKTEFIRIDNFIQDQQKLRFCAFKIFHCNINHFQSLQELNNLYFDIPQTQFTKHISNIDIYLHCWKDGKIFKRYPTSGIILKINSKKLQKYLKANNQPIEWEYSIKK